ncbi:hypothetical protein [Thermus sp.]|uniref:hypothetical protein n=1 Tax=Thermus sp. TaxID=275 RepID=UPI00261A7264|nr:hypothetical protein [Thermus sp.]MCX7850831.1 hypothetical protein [Thermus sp.]
MGALISGLLDLLQWLASTFASLAGWLVSTVQAVAAWLWGVVSYALVWLWNALVDVLTWVLNLLFWLLGVLLEIPIDLLTALVRMLPETPASLKGALSIIVPAYNVANQILPLSEAIAIGSLWLGFYGLMAVWRVITFIRGGR